MRYIPTEKQLSEKVKLVEIQVEGEFIARIDEKRKTSRAYKVTVYVPEKFNKSDIKRQTPKVLAKDFAGEFISMRTFNQASNPKKTEKTIARKELYSPREVARFAKLRVELNKQQRAEIARRRAEGDTSEYDPNTGLPPIINEDD